MVDETQLSFYGVVLLSIRLKNVITEEVFVESNINKDVILRMPFLVTHKCAKISQQFGVFVDSWPLTWMDRHGGLSYSEVQVVRYKVVPARTKMNTSCWVTTRTYFRVEVIESCPVEPSLATSLNRPEPKGCTATPQPYRPSPTAPLSWYHSQHLHRSRGPPGGWQTTTLWFGCRFSSANTPVVRVSAHLEDLFGANKAAQSQERPRSWHGCWHITRVHSAPLMEIWNGPLG